MGLPDCLLSGYSTVYALHAPVPVKSAANIQQAGDVLKAGQLTRQSG